MSSENTGSMRSTFASRMLNKVLTERKTTGSLQKISPADAAKYAAEEKAKETTTIKS